jgi:hypothetical protein
MKILKPGSTTNPWNENIGGKRFDNPSTLQFTTSTP